MTQEYLLMSVPKTHAGTVISLGGTILAPLPEGTYLLDIQAYWHATEPGENVHAWPHDDWSGPHTRIASCPPGNDVASTKFRGGAAGFKAKLGEAS